MVKSVSMRDMFSKLSIELGRTECAELGTRRAAICIRGPELSVEASVELYAEDLDALVTFVEGGPRPGTHRVFRSAPDDFWIRLSVTALGLVIVNARVPLKWERGSVRLRIDLEPGCLDIER